MILLPRPASAGVPRMVVPLPCARREAAHLARQRLVAHPCYLDTDDGPRAQTDCQSVLDAEGSVLFESS
jgi:hypothetical protein